MRTPRKPIEPFSFTVLATLLVVIFVFQIVLLRFLIMIIVPPAPRETRDAYAVEDRMSVDFQATNGDVIRAERASTTELDRYEPVLRSEMAKYEPEIVKTMRLKRVILCSGLTMNGKEIGGFAVGPEGAIVLNVSSPGPGEEFTFRRAIHHELFHVMDTILGPAAEGDEPWANLNPEDFRYGGDEILSALEVTRESPGRRPEIPGLLNYYAMVSAQEDRAELYSWMMTAPDSLHAIALEDEMIRKKMDRIKRELLRLSRGFDAILKPMAPGD